jgi:hypothetical protein
MLYPILPLDISNTRLLVHLQLSPPPSQQILNSPKVFLVDAAMLVKFIPATPLALLAMCLHHI